MKTPPETHSEPIDKTTMKIPASIDERFPWELPGFMAPARSQDKWTRFECGCQAKFLPKGNDPQSYIACVSHLLISMRKELDSQMKWTPQPILDLLANLFKAKGEWWPDVKEDIDTKR